MTLKDYATIQRHLGYIEGVVDQYNKDNDKVAVFGAISVIDRIIDKEVEEDG